MDIQLNFLVAEITRRCNMKCAHCLRGNAQRTDMDSSIIHALTCQLSGVGTLNFTGGEPSLNADAIQQFMHEFMFNDCTVDNFWVTTNARFYKEDFLNALTNLYAICQEPEECILTISGDQYHYVHSNKAYAMYLETPFFSDQRMRLIEDCHIINEGNAKKNQFGCKEVIPQSTISDFYIFENELVINDMVYVNALGDVLLACDLSYQSQKKYVLGNILKEPLKTILIRNLDEKILKELEEADCA